VADPSNSPIYVFTKEAVTRSVGVLTRNVTHEHVPGYLAIMRSQASMSGIPSRMADINEVYDRYLRVAGAPAKFPYVRAFVSRGKGLKLSNDHVGGSYAVSNRRAGGPFFSVVDVTGERTNAEYRLRADHANLAMNNLLQGNKLPITALTVFMYRDYAFELAQASVPAVVTLFQEEFGLKPNVPEQQKAYETLFYDDSGSYTSTDLESVGGQVNG
jgi:hypothetical protein